MPLLHDNKEAVTANDVQALQELLKGSIESIQARLRKAQKDDPEKRAANAYYPPLLQVFQKGIESLPNLLESAQNGKAELTVSEFINQFHADLADKFFNAMDEENEVHLTSTPGFYHHLGGKYYASRLFPSAGLLERDNPEIFKEQVDRFKLADEPMEGVQDIAEYKPDSGRVLGLYDARSGNSTSLKDGRIKELEDLVKDAEETGNKEAYETNMKDLIAARKAPFGLHAGAEFARIRSSEMMNKKHITFADVYEIYTNINKMVRPGDPEAGKLRGTYVSAGNLIGPSATAIPQQSYHTLQTIADNMNKIKQTEDPALRKTRAIQLAAFAYQMTLSEHVFGDGNGRTCRLFADSILQTFGLPPHTPTKAQSDIMKTIGEDGGMSFEDGAKVFMENVKKSDAELKKDPELKETIKKKAQPMPEKKPGGIQEKYSTKLSAIYEVNDDTVETLRQLKKSSENARGRFRDSQEYKDFMGAIDRSYALAARINLNKDADDFDLKTADAEYASSIRKLLKSAADYKEYKMKDHTADKSKDPGKKNLNEKDKSKLALMDSVIENKDLIKVKTQEPKAPSL